jgi:hypothetical protein
MLEIDLSENMNKQEPVMTLDDRKNAFENKFAHDSELMFKAEARACKLFGLWLAGEMGLSGADADAYAKTVVGANLDEPGFDDVKRFVMKDIAAKGLSLTEHTVDAKLAHCLDDAKKQLAAE